MLPFDEARARLLSDVRPLPAERVPLRDAAGRVLAEDIVAPFPVPSFDGSAMDGYAVRLDDLRGDGPWTLPVVGESRTGHEAPDLVPGTTCRIFTGAILPRRANAVVMQEVVERSGDTATFRDRPPPFAHVRRAGEDLAEGTTALSRRTRLGPAQLALAAALDRAELVVARRPVVTILSTGDELRAPGTPSRPATIPESNGVGLALFAERAGAVAHILPIVRDDPEETARAIVDALRTTDLLLTVGGVSVGDHDVVRPALERAGVQLDFWKVAIKPGKPIAVGKSEHGRVLGLPGNPVSALVTFLLFGMPLLRVLQSDAHPLPRRGRATLASELRRSPGRMELLRVTLEWHDDTLIAKPLSNQASGALAALARSDGLLVIPEGASVVPAGSVLDLIRLEDV